SLLTVFLGYAARPLSLSHSYTLSLLHFFPAFFMSRKCHRTSNTSGKSSPRWPPSLLLPLHPFHQQPHHLLRPPLPRSLLLRGRNIPYNLRRCAVVTP